MDQPTQGASSGNNNKEGTSGGNENNTGNQLWDAVYSRFLLRDLCGKVAPGSIIAGSILVVMYGWEWFGSLLKSVLTGDGMSIGSTILWIGIAWVLGFVPQSLGYICFNEGFYWPNSKCKCWRHDQKYCLPVKKKEFSNGATDGEKNLLERYTAIKEACGNTSLAILIAFGFFAVKHYVGMPWRAIVIGAAVSIFLFVMYRAHVSRQLEWIFTKDMKCSCAWSSQKPPDCGYKEKPSA